MHIDENTRCIRKTMETYDGFRSCVFVAKSTVKTLTEHGGDFSRNRFSPIAWQRICWLATALCEALDDMEPPKDRQENKKPGNVAQVTKLPGRASKVIPHTAA